MTVSQILLCNSVEVHFYYVFDIIDPFFPFCLSVHVSFFTFFWRIAKKMLLAQIKSNYSSGAESSSDNDGADKDEKSSKKVKKEDEDEDEEEEQQGNIHIPSCFQISLCYCVSSQTSCFSLWRQGFRRL